jgi:hypothetical protein
MRCTKGTSWYNKRPDGVARIFHRSKHIVEPQADEASNVFTNDPSGPQRLNDRKHRIPEVAVIACASALAGRTKGLAGEASGNKVNVLKCV